MNMPLRAALFPGQGSQTPDIPTDTAQQQPAILNRSVESWRQAGTRCDWFAGHSLGSYSALVAAGALDAATANAVVTVRGGAMADAGKSEAGSMIALLGCRIEDAMRIAGEHGLTVANDNAPGQVVLSGAVGAIDLLEAAKPVFVKEGRERAVRLKRLPVSGAFHSLLMKPAETLLTQALAAAEFGDASRVVANGTARPYENPRAELAAELLAPVRWRESLQFMWEQGVREFIEFEPAGVLTALVKRTLPDARAFGISDLVAASGS